MANNGLIAISEAGTGYHDLIAHLWEQGETFVVVEQDNVVGKHTLRDLLDCAHPWCGNDYYFGQDARGIPNMMGHVALGCTKFDASLMQRFPKLMQRVGEFGCPAYNEPPYSHANCDTSAVTHDGSIPKSWVRLDARMQTVLQSEHGVTSHLHEPIEHLHDFTHRDNCQCDQCVVRRATPMYKDYSFNPLEWKLDG